MQPRVAGPVLLTGVSLAIGLNKNYANTTHALAKSPGIAVLLTASIYLTYSAIMESIMNRIGDGIPWGLAFKPLVTMVAYAGTVFTADSPESMPHMASAALTFWSMSTDLMLVKGGWPLVMGCACFATFGMMPRKYEKHLKVLEVVFGILFSIGVLFSEE